MHVLLCESRKNEEYFSVKTLTNDVFHLRVSAAISGFANSLFGNYVTQNAWKTKTEYCVY